MKTKHEFHVGQRVQMTERGLDEFPGFTHPHIGVVKSIGDGVIVVENDSYISGFSDVLWEPISDIADNTRYCPTCGQRLP